MVAMVKRYQIFQWPQCNAETRRLVSIVGLPGWQLICHLYLTSSSTLFCGKFCIIAAYKHGHLSVCLSFRLLYTECTACAPVHNWHTLHLHCSWNSISCNSIAVWFFFFLFLFLSVRYMQERAFLLWPHAISIIIVQRYTGNYRGFVTVCNVESTQLLIFVSGTDAAPSTW